MCTPQQFVDSAWFEGIHRDATELLQKLLVVIDQFENSRRQRQVHHLVEFRRWESGLRLDGFHPWVKQFDPDDSTLL
jgi:hypothetical protein